MPDKRHEDLQQKIQQAYALLSKLESRLLYSSDPKEQFRTRDDIAETKKQIAELQAELNNSGSSNAQVQPANNVALHGSQGTIGTVHGNVTQNYYNGPTTQKGDVKVGDEIHIGNITNSNVNIKSKLEHVKQLVQTMPTGSQEDKKQLDAKIEELKTALAAIPATHSREVERVGESLEYAIQEIKSDNPDPEEVQERSNKIVKAAQNVAKVAGEIGGPVVTAATAILDVLHKLGLIK